MNSSRAHRTIISFVLLISNTILFSLRVSSFIILPQQQRQQQQYQTKYKINTKNNNNILCYASSKQSAKEEAKQLRKQATHIKLEAELMNMELTLHKITNIEDTYEKLIKHPEIDNQNKLKVMQDQIDFISRQIDDVSP